MFIVLTIFNLFASYSQKDNLIDNIVSDISIFPSDELTDKIKERIDEKKLVNINKEDLDYIVNKIISDLEKKYSKDNNNIETKRTYASVVSEMDYLVDQISEAIDRMNETDRSLSFEEISLLVNEISEKINLRIPETKIDTNNKWYILVLKIAIVLALVYLIYLFVMKIIFWHRKLF